MAINASLVHDGQVDVEAFTSAVLAGVSVGVCDCGGLLDGAAEETGRLLWLTIRCRACGNEQAAPGGRVLPRRAGARPGQEPWVLEAASELERRRLGESEGD